MLWLASSNGAGEQFLSETEWDHVSRVLSSYTMGTITESVFSGPLPIETDVGIILPP